MKTKYNTTKIAGYKTGKIVPWLQGFFTFHTGSAKYEAAFEEISLAAEAFANVLVTKMPEGEDRNRVLGTIRSVVLTANNAIQLGGAIPVPYLGHGTVANLGTASV